MQRYLLEGGPDALVVVRGKPVRPLEVEEQVAASLSVVHVCGGGSGELEIVDQ